MILNSLTLQDVENMFISSDKCCFITIKPAPDHVIQYNMIEYLKKKFKEFWIVSCMSERGYFHYHGIVKLHDNDGFIKTMKAFARKVNRDIGFFHYFQMEKPIVVIYDYIRHPRNNCNNTYIQQDYYRLAIR